MFIYSGSIKIHASGFDKLLESIFCILLVVEAFSLQKVVHMFEEVMVRGQANVEEEAKLCSPIHSTFEELDVQATCGRASSWRRIGPFLLTNASRRHCSFQHLIDLLTILPSCNDFARIQNAVVDQSGSKSPNSDCDLLVQV